MVTLSLCVLSVISILSLTSVQASVQTAILLSGALVVLLSALLTGCLPDMPLTELI